MPIDSENCYTIEKINTFNKLMIKTINVEKDKFEFDGKYYMVCSDGICVQTLINDSFLYRIFIEDHKDNILVSPKLLNYLKNWYITNYYIVNDVSIYSSYWKMIWSAL